LNHFKSLTSVRSPTACISTHNLTSDPDDPIPDHVPDPGLPIDLSLATKLRELKFWCRYPTVRWIVDELETITPDHGNVDISIEIDHRNVARVDRRLFADIVGEAVYTGWSDLDGLLVRLSESRLIRLKIIYYESSPMETMQGGTWVERLLPEAMKREIVDPTLFGRRYGIAQNEFPSHTRFDV
jgi:hypothetical protein